jgi:FKBP-type peptidyl-prolyl cis-trans isomerase SlyD
MRIVRDAFVVLDYALHDEDGDVIEATDEEGGRPIGFVYGYGSLVSGLEARLAGMAAGETREIVVPPEEGYGAWDEEKEFWVDRAELPAELALDDELEATDESGDEITMRMVEIGEDAVLVDTNHPLAGETLFFDVIVRAVRKATAEELAKTKANAPKARLAMLPSGPPSARSDAPAEALASEGPSPEAPHALQPPSADSVATAPPGVGAPASDEGVRTGHRSGKLTDDEQ